MKRLLLFIKQNVLLFILICFTATVVMMYTLSGSGASHCRFVYDFQVCDFGPDGQDEELQTPVETLVENSKNSIDVSKYTPVMPVSIGTKWIYEGKRLFYDRMEQKEKEVIAKKVAEVTAIEKDGENLKVSVRETYVNDPEFTEREISYWISENGIASTGNNVVNFPFVKGQELFNDDPSQKRTDGLYADIVTSVDTKNILGKEYRCYDISKSTLGSTSFETFCEGVGYVRDYYEHHGTPDEWDYRLISLVN